MTEITLTIPSLTGGVSTQPEPLRLPQQAQRSENVVASIVEGLRKRSPTEFQSRLQGHTLDRVSHHPMHRPDGDYVAAFSDQGLAIYDLADPDGLPLTLRNTRGELAQASDFSYLETSDPKRDLRFLSVADYTLVLNRSKTVAESAATTTAVPSQALVQVKTGAYRTIYRVGVEGGGDRIEVTFETYSAQGAPPNTTNPSTSTAEAEDSVKTESIAEELFSLLTTGNTTGVVGGSVAGGMSTGLPAANWTVRRSGSVISIERVDGQPIKLTTSDSKGDTLFRAVNGKAQLFSDLPTKALVGMKVEVEGDPSESENTYWTEFTAEGADPGTFADGYWRESVAPTQDQGLDSATMPHALLRQSDGSFQWTPLDGQNYLSGGEEFEVPEWTRRSVGDSTSNTTPPFVGKKLLDMCMHDGRLGLLCEDALTLSETRQPWNFYRTTVLDSLDTERLLLQTNNVNTEPLSHAVPLGSDVVLLSDGMQFLVRSEGALTPTTVSLNTVGRYDCSPTCQPIQVRDALMVPTDRAGRAAIHEMRVTGDRRPRLERIDITASANDYVGRASTMISTPELDMMVVTSDDERALWVYTHYWNNGERIQQAWQKWTFRHNPQLLHSWFHESALWMVVNLNGQIHLLKMRCAPFENDGALPLVHLDNRIDSARCVPFELGTDDTGFILPYEPQGPVRIIEKSTGKELQSLGVSGAVIGVEGKHLYSDLWIGEDMDVRHDLSRIQRFDQNRAPIVGPELHLDTAVVQYEDSGPFEVVIMDSAGHEYTTRFMGPTLGLGANYEKMRMTSGRLKVGVRGRALESRISIRSSEPWPLRIISLDVQARELRQHGSRT